MFDSIPSGTFVYSFSLIGLAELGDKSQLVRVTLAVRHPGDDFVELVAGEPRSAEDVIAPGGAAP